MESLDGDEEARLLYEMLCKSHGKRDVDRYVALMREVGVRINATEHWDRSGYNTAGSKRLVLGAQRPSSEAHASRKTSSKGLPVVRILGRDLGQAIRYVATCSNDIWNACSTPPMVEEARWVTTMEDVEDLDVQIFGHGDLAKPEQGEMSVRLLRAECPDASYNARSIDYKQEQSPQ